MRRERNLAFSNLFRKKYGGKTLYEVQRILADKIGREFAQLIGYTGEIEQLPLYLKGLLEGQIKKI